MKNMDAKEQAKKRAATSIQLALLAGTRNKTMISLRAQLTARLLQTSERFGTSSSGRGPQITVLFT